MAHESDLLQDSEEILKRFAVVEEVARIYETIEAKKAASADTIQALDLHLLIGKVCMADSSLVFAKRPHEPATSQLMFPNGFLFIGEIDNFGQQIDEDIPIDARTVQFTNPEVFALAADEHEAFKTLRFEIPFLAINTHVVAQTA